MARLMIYLIPALMDMVVGIIAFVGATRTADAGLSPTAVTSILAAWAIVYVLSCRIVGRFVTTRNAAWLVFSACLFIGACEIGLILLPSIAFLYVTMVLLGIGTALLFVPFQIFMKAADGNHAHGISGPIGLYTFAWSAGYAAGPFVCGFIMHLWSWQWCHVVGAAVSVVSAIIMLMLRHLAHVDADQTQLDVTDEPQEPQEPDTSARRPDLAWLAWIAAGAGFGVMIMIRALFASTGKALDVPRVAWGTVLGVMTGVQAIMGLVLMRSRRWMYRARSVGAFALVGTFALVIFVIACNVPAHQTLLFHVAAALFGVYAGSVCFYLVFHALIHPTRGSRYVAINESVVGIVSTVVPLAGGGIASITGDPSTPYMGAIGAILLAGMLQVIIHRRRPWPAAL